MKSVTLLTVLLYPCILAAEQLASGKWIIAAGDGNSIQELNIATFEQDDSGNWIVSLDVHGLEYSIPLATVKTSKKPGGRQYVTGLSTRAWRTESNSGVATAIFRATFDTDGSTEGYLHTFSGNGREGHTFAMRLRPLSGLSGANIGKIKIPPRDPGAARELIDLSAWYNASLVGDWHHSKPGNDLASLPVGVHSFDGTEFDIRGLIQLRASDPGSASYPVRVEGIPIGFRSAKLHFLHNTLFGRLVPAGEVIGAYNLNYEDGKSVTVPLRMGHNVLDWFGSGEELAGKESTTLAWQGTNQWSAKRGKSIHLIKFTWDNPRPEVKLRSLDFVSQDRMAAPFLVAVTAEP